MTTLRPARGPRRVSGRLVAVGLSLVIAAAVTFAIARWYAERWPEGDVLFAVAVDPERALLMRRASDGEFFADMVLVDRENGPVWRTGIYGLELAGPEGVTVGDGLVTVRATDASGRPETHAFGLDDGRFAWRHRPGLDRPADGGLSLVRGSTLYEVRGGTEVLVSALERATGRERWHRRLPAPPLPARVGAEAGRLVLSGGGEITILDESSGALTQPSPRSAGGACTVAGAIVEGEPDGVRLASLVGAQAQRQPVEGGWHIGAFCGRRGQRLIVFGADTAGHAHGALAVALGTGRVDWRIDLPGAPSLDTTARQWLAGEPADDSLPRFLPVVTGEGDDSILVVLDLDRGQIASRRRLLRGTARIVRSAGMSWLTRDDGLLVGFDRAGAPAVAAVIGTPRSPAAMVRIGHFSGDRLWVHDAGAIRPLSSRTLRPLHGASRYPSAVTVSDLDRLLPGD